MKYSCYFLLLFIAAGFGCTPSNSTESASKKPNIVLIMADDLGYSDIGSYGGEIKTPALDGLAENGLRFTNFYNTARCCPTRASMLTGLYPHQAGIGRMTFDNNKPGYRGFLTDNTATVAELLKQSGYNTGMVGKWHLSPTKALEEQEHLAWLAHQKDFGDFSDTTTYPVARGFDKYFGNIWGVVDYFDPFSLVNGKEVVQEIPDGYYYTDAIGDSAVAYVDQFSKTEDPFFLYVAHCAPHWPLQALPEDIKKYEDVYDEGWEVLRERRYKRMVEMGLLDEEVAELSPPVHPKLTWESNPDKKWDARAMAVHAAMVDRMDKTIGDLVQKLKESGEYENTVIMFLSDNGASPERPSKYGPGFDRAGSTRDGKKVQFPVDKSEDALPGPQTVHAGIGPAWANALNTPFRYYKAKNFEGGIATPFIVHWPAGLKQKKGITRQTGHVVDIMATCLDLAKTSYPQNFEGRKLTPMVGKSLLPVLKGAKRKGHDNLFWEHMGARAIRKDGWKLVMLNKKSDWELYNLKEDRTETKNLAAQFPEKVKELAKLWNEEAHQYQVFPAPN